MNRSIGAFIATTAMLITSALTVHPGVANAAPQLIGIEAYQYLADGTCGIGDRGNGVVALTGSTKASEKVEEIAVTIYLQYLSGSNWVDIGGPWKFTDWDVSAVYGGLDGLAEPGYSYRSRCVHEVRQGGVYETGYSVSDRLDL